MLGASGFAIVLVFAIAGAAIVGVLFITYLAHYLLEAFEDTAAGEDIAPWLGQSPFEVLWKPFYLLGMLAPAFIPVAVLMVMVAPGLATHPGGLIFVVVFLVWIIFPVLLLSSYFSGMWVSLNAGVLAGMIRNSRAVLIFYAITGALLAAAGIAGYLSLNGGFGIVLITSIFAGAAPLLYGRLLGRLAFLLDNPLRRRKGGKKRRRKRKLDEVEDDWSAPAAQPLSASEQIMAAATPHPIAELIEPEEDEYDRCKKPYGLMSDAAVELEMLNQPKGDPGVIGKLEALPPIGVEKPPVDEEAAKQEGRFQSLAALFLRRVWTFPFYGGNLTRWANAALLTMGVILLFKLIRFAWGVVE